MSKCKKIISISSIIIFIGIIIGFVFYQSMQPSITLANPDTYPIKNTEGEIVGTYTMPSDLNIQNESNADEILYGKRLHNETKRLLPDNVGAMMNCNSCHIAQGRAEFGAHYINTINTYPTVKPRGAVEIDVITRINGCFQRSMNGKALDRDSKEMKAMVAYMEWLRQDVPKGFYVDIHIGGDIDTSIIPDSNRGERLYATQCATCHGNNGEGLTDSRGDIVFPPLWGKESFNIGAGMARTYKAAAFIRDNMPMSVHPNGPWGEGHRLSDQDAVDVAEYFTHQPRPDFPGKVNDWPKGNKPKDARY